MVLSKIKQMAKGIVLDNELMSKHTSYGIGGKVLAYIRPFNKYELIKIIKLLNEHNSKIYFIGSGSNLLVNDKNIDAYIITPAKALKSFNIYDDTITAESGVMLGKIVKESIKRGLILFYFLLTKTAVRISPPLTISKSEIEKGCNIIIEILNSCRD